MTALHADKYIDTIRNEIIVVTTKECAKFNSIDVNLLDNNQEEADTLLILHALYAEKITIITPVFIIALQKYPLLGPKVFLQLGTGCKRREVHLEPNYHELNPVIVEGLIAFHAFTESDTTGRIAGKGKMLEIF